MSRKRKSKQAPTVVEVIDEAVPEEVLAEGSGEISVAVRVGGEEIVELEAASDAAPPNAHDLADIAAVIEAVIEPGLVGGEITDVQDGDAAAIAVAGEGDEGLQEVETDEEVLAAGAELPTSAASMDVVQLKHLVEALVFASDKPMTLLRLRQLTRVSDTKRLEDTLAALAEDYRERGIVLQQVSGGYQFRTRTQFSGWVQQLIAGRPVRLSRAQLETLAIIAYRQPITRPEIDDIRGVDSSGTLKVLIDRALIRVLGKKEDVGRPMLYGTTKEFLDFFSLGDLRELPTLREYSELTDESRQVMSDRLGVAIEETSPADAPIADISDAVDALSDVHAAEVAFRADDELSAAVADDVVYRELPVNEAVNEAVDEALDADAPVADDAVAFTSEDDDGYDRGE